MSKRHQRLMEESGSHCQCSKRRLVLILTAAVLVAASLAAVAVGIFLHTASADPPPLLTPPYMRLEALFEEPLGHGWGVDIPGYGPTLNLSSLQVNSR